MLNQSPIHCFCATVVATWIGIVVGPIAAAQQSTVQAQLVSGSKVDGTINTLEGDLVSLSTSEGIINFEFEKLNSINFGIEPQTPTRSRIKIQLVDGSELNAKSVAVESRKLVIELHCGIDLTISTRDVEFIQFKTYENELELNRQWRDVLADNSREGDAIVVNRDNELNLVEGIVGDLDGEKLSFSIEDRTARVSLEKLDAILFYHATGREFTPPICQVLLADNSTILARELKWEIPNVKTIAVCGAKVDVHGSSLARLNFSLGRDVWLSSLEPSTNDWQPLITSSAIMEKLRRLKLARVNQSYSGQPLSLKFHPDNGLSFLAQTKQFENGYAIQSGGKLAFALNHRFQKLTGWVGFDPTASPSGNVLFKVLVDGKVILEKELISRAMKNPLELNLDVRDADRIVFQVDYHDGRSTGDQLHLVNLKVTR